MIYLLFYQYYFFSYRTRSMRSSRYRKLMEGSKQLNNHRSIEYEVIVSEGVTCKCELEVWNQEILQELEGSPPIKELLIEFKDWIELPAQILGKKSSEVVISKSQQYCLKSINQEDFQTFRKIFTDYIEFKRSAKQSILIPIIGVVNLFSQYQTKNRWADSFIIMPNLKPNDGIVFDVKGHVDSRLVSEVDFKDFKFGKDENFIRSQQRNLLLQSPRQFREELFHKMQTNILFLKSCKVIDYSLLLVFYKDDQQNSPLNTESQRLSQNWCMRWAIIDFFQLYNQRKKLENKLKSLFYKEISSVDPESYANRLLQFLRKTILTA